jgi:[calcium/calmodulin-dependent protein kinase] kinase
MEANTAQPPTTLIEEVKNPEPEVQQIPAIDFMLYEGITKRDGHEYLNDNILLQEELGKGAFCKVRKVQVTFNYMDEGIAKEETLPYALKIFNKEALTKKIFCGLDQKEQQMSALDRLYNEIEIHKKMNHDNVIRLFAVIDSVDSEKFYLMMQYCDLGDVMIWQPQERKYKRNPKVYKQLRENEINKGVPLEQQEMDEYVNSVGGVIVEQAAKFIFKALAGGIAYLHSKVNVVHRDIKWENVLARTTDDKEVMVKVIDFSISEDISDDPSRVFFDTQGTPEYLAPDMSDENGYLPKPVDIWALGLCLYTFLFQKFPFENTKKTADDAADDNSIIKLEFLGSISEKCQDLLQRMLDRDPLKRINIEEILKHPWLN